MQIFNDHDGRRGPTLTDHVADDVEQPRVASLRIEPGGSTLNVFDAKKSAYQRQIGLEG